MTSGQKLIWKLRLQDAGGIAVCLVVSWTGLRLVTVLADWHPKLGAQIRWAILLAVGMFLCWSWFLTRRSRQGENASGDAQAGLVGFEAFVQRPDALIVPNHQHLESAIRDWLQGFILRHGAHSVVVVADADEPHLCDRLFLLADSLSSEERQELARLGADGVKTVSLARQRTFFPQLEDSKRAFEVMWD